MLAIAELAGADWLKQACAAAERLSRTTSKPSYGRQLLAALRTMFGSGCKEKTSADIVAELLSDRDAGWCEYKRGAPITQRQVADLLEQYEIFPTVIHPTKRASLSRHGYRREQFADAFARYLLPIRTSEHRRSSKVR